MRTARLLCGWLVCSVLGSCSGGLDRADGSVDANHPMDTGAADSITGGLPVCSPHVVPSSQVFFGFHPAVSQTFHGVVAETAADHLVVTSDAGESYMFGWAGPSLATEFSVGEDVMGEQALGGVVTSATRRAEVLASIAFSPLSESGSIGGGVSYSIVPDCADVYADSCIPGIPDSATLTVVMTRYTIDVTAGAESVTIPFQATKDVGGLRVTNVNVQQGRQFPSSTCPAEFSNCTVITTLGPPLP